MNNKYDLIILGSGPAGLSAAIYASRAMLNFIVIEKLPYSGGQIIITPDIENYPGYATISGAELMQNFRKHAEKLGAKFVEDDVKSVVAQDGGYALQGADEKYFCKALIVAAGATHKKLEIPGEEKFTGRGVSYCATCDGSFFRGKTTAVVGGGDTAATDALVLAKLCSKVYLIVRKKDLRASATLKKRMEQTENIQIMCETEVAEILGENSVSELILKTTSGEKKIACDGVFVAIGNSPNSAPVIKLLKTDENGFIEADETGATGISGVFAAGDVRTKALRQVVTAAADGASCVYSVEKYLQSL
ncbi:MAG: thioredoxin-disulfide reductase [Oscillospiraceae bacterium]|jgi:thioredoxin reductase (NADPH)|nr:thioredoxin-disulfide reductase [Oscillospiraceae bacterium]